jgi:hypothetical protein
MEKTKDTYENFIVKKFERNKKIFDESENLINDYYSKIVDDLLEKATSINDLNNIKERLIIMPMCSSKVLLFRKIILKEKDFQH